MGVVKVGYRVYDTQGQMLKEFSDYKGAYTFIIMCGRMDFDIKVFNYYDSKLKVNKVTTDRQRSAVGFIEEWINMKFTGDITNPKEVCPFLSKYLDTAKGVKARFDEALHQAELEEAMGSYDPILDGVLKDNDED